MYITGRLKFEFCLDGRLYKICLIPKRGDYTAHNEFNAKSKQATICIRYFAEIHNFLKIILCTMFIAY